MTDATLFDTADTQAIALALQKLSEQRPGWKEYLRGIAEKLPACAGYFDAFVAMEHPAGRIGVSILKLDVPDIELRGRPCEEASTLSRETFIACGKPASFLVFHSGDGRAYRMCYGCASHNVKNRGGVLVGRDPDGEDRDVGKLKDL